MIFAYIVTFLICVIGAIVTFSLTKEKDENYTSEQSVSNLLYIYLIGVPALILIMGGAALIWMYVF